MKVNRVIGTMSIICLMSCKLWPSVSIALKKSKRVKEFEKDIDLKKQGVITVKYKEI